jgi:hypothetical protein
MKLLTTLTALAVALAVSTGAFAQTLDTPTERPDVGIHVTAQPLDCGAMFDFVQLDPTTVKPPFADVLSPDQLSGMYEFATVTEYQKSKVLDNATLDAANADVEYCLAHPITQAA